ncbi:SRPBCC family protein [Streptomycetaceae bacterium NBC_01309]
MAERTRSSITIDATPAEVMAVIAGFSEYPDWTGEVKEAEVLEKDEQIGRGTRVRFVLDAAAIKDEHVLAYTWDGDREVRWTLVTSQMLKSLDGTYALEPLESGTEVTYELRVDVKIPMLGMIKRKAEKVIIDRALSGLKKRVEQRPDTLAKNG